MGFNALVDRVLDHEGGYVNDPDDPGGETNHGISKRAYPDLDIAGLTDEDAAAIYRRDYWDTLRGDELATSERLKGSLLDMAVNAGSSRAVKLLQRAVNSFMRSQVAEDGQIGAITLAAVQGIPGDRLLWAYTVRRGAYYMALATKRPASKRFLAGWLRRAFSWLEVDG